MSVYFPQINSSGLLVQRPYQISHDFNTVLVPMPFGRPYSLSKRGSGLTGFPTKPLLRATVSLPSISDSEVQTIQAFFLSMGGRLNEFIYLDPGGNLINNSEDWSQTSWTSQATSVSIAATGVTDPFGGSRATTLLATSSNSTMSPIVVPLGSLPAGFVLCASTWVRALAANQTLCIGFVDSGFSVLNSVTWALPINRWVQIYANVAVGTSSYIRALFGGLGTWNSTSIQFFGPQCVPMKGPGGYQKSPDNFGYHPTCRFDTDRFSYTAKAPNDNSVSLPVVEYAT